MNERRSAAIVLGVVLASPLLFAAESKPLPKDLPPFGEDRPLPVPAIAQSTLPNGLSVWIVRRSGFPRVVAVLAVRGGRAADPPEAEGISEVLAVALKEGTTTRSSRQIAEELQAAGADLVAQAGADAIYLQASGLGPSAPRILEVLADLARNAAFPPAEVELARTNAIQGLQAREATPEFVAQKAFASAVYGEHPYHVVAASKGTLEKATPDLLRREHARRFRPEGALLVVVGDFDVAAVMAAVIRHFGPWKGRGESLPDTPTSPTAGPRRLVVVDRPGSVQSQILVGRPGPTVTDPGYYPALLANTICSGAFASRLVLNLREDKGYSYSPGGDLVTRRRGGLLMVQADVRTEVTGASLLETFYELDRMGATLPTEEELARAKRYEAGLYLLRNQIQAAVASTLATNWVSGLPAEALGEYVSKVNAVTPEQVREAGRSTFASATQTVVVVGDAPRVEEELKLFGVVATQKP